MRARSWMAALALVVGTSIAVGRAMPALVTNQVRRRRQSARTPRSSQTAARDATIPKASGTRVPSVQLNLVIAGLGPKGCDVQVKPGNASCKFSPVYEKRGENRQFVAALTAEPASSCATSSFAAPTERSQSPSRSANQAKLQERSIAVSGSRASPRRKVPTHPATAPAFTCYLSSPSKLAKADESRTRR